jgi:puromycin-sensitive aminopeptidase
MSQQTTSTPDAPTESYRLPREVVPVRYEIKLEPNIDAATFSGIETIEIEVKAPVREILLNAIELKIESAVVHLGSKESKAETELQESEERLLLKFKDTIEPGKHKLIIKFSGILNDKLHGFYRSKYKDANGKDAYIATTQLEATDARRAFPCWDEPDFKAVFSIALTVEQAHQAISNASVDKEEKIAGSTKKIVHFKDTIKMSTYLVAFIVGPFEATPPQMVNGTPIRILGLPGKLAIADFAKGIAAHSIEFFEKYFGVKYPGDKLDLIAIPDFAFGAMENLGAVTFRETALLVDQKSASHAELERVADVVAHEIAHMWFGDLTTMRWWNGIWLNEAFATFMEMAAVDSWKPNWKRWETFGVSRALAYATDGLSSTRSIEFPIGRPEEAQAMFDVLTYQKGASVLRMLEQYIGVEQFKKGVSAYLHKFQYANTETIDLWNALEEASKMPVGEIMESWIFGKGFPLVTVEMVSSGKVRFQQKRFLYLKEEDHGGKKELFHVPLIVKAKVGNQVTTKKVLLKDDSTEMDFEGDVVWIIANAGGHGFYRIRYEGEARKNLSREVIRSLDAIERFNLVNDSWALVVSGDMALKDYLSLISLFDAERDKNVWTTIIGSLTYLYRAIDRSEQPKLSKFVVKLLAPVLKEIGWGGSKSDTADGALDTVRGQLVSALGIIGNDQSVQAECEKLLAKYFADKTSVNPELAADVISVCACIGDSKRFEAFAKAFQEAAIPQEQDRFMYALAGFRDESLLKRALEMCVKGEVRSQSAPFLIRSVMINPYGGTLAWKFVTERWSELLKLYPDQLTVRMLDGITGLVTSNLLKETKAFLKEHPISIGEKTIAQYLEKQTIAVAFKEREAKFVKEELG